MDEVAIPAALAKMRQAIALIQEPWPEAPEATNEPRMHRSARFRGLGGQEGLGIEGESEISVDFRWISGMRSGFKRISMAFEIS